VNAERTTAWTPGELSLGTRTLRLLQLDRLARLFGFGPPEVPRRPEIRHPLERLVFHNFTIYELHRGHPGRQYLSLPDVEVVRKLGWRELGNGQCEYRFELNAAPDSIWHCFYKCLLSDSVARFENKTMVLVCFPADLESAYEQIKEAMAGANVWHADERDELIEQVQALHETELAAREREEARKLGLCQQFDELQL
jgi:hypothetical protein